MLRDAKKRVILEKLAAVGLIGRSISAAKSRAADGLWRAALRARPEAYRLD